MDKLKVMLVDKDRGRAALLQQALIDADYEVIAVINDSSQLLPAVRKTAADIIIIDLESPDRDTLEHVHIVNREQPKPVVMFAEDDNVDVIQASVRAGVSAYVFEPFGRKRLRPILEVAIARFREYQAMRKELDDTKSRLAERKIIEKAKGLIMQHKGLDEESAYQTLRKMAMDRNLRLVDVAKNIISVIEILN